MTNLSRYDRRYTALWFPMVGVLLAGFGLLALFVIGVMLMAGLGLAGGALKAGGHVSFWPAGLPQLSVGLAFVPLIALVIPMLTVGGVMAVLIRVIAFETRRRSSRGGRRSMAARGRPGSDGEQVFPMRPTEPALRFSEAADDATEESRGPDDD